MKTKKEKKATTSTQMEKFVAVKKNAAGNLCEFKSESGKVYDYEMAVEAVEKGKVENAMLFTGRDGKKHIKSKTDKSKKDNLSNLKEF